MAWPTNDDQRFDQQNISQSADIATFKAGAALTQYRQVYISAEKTVQHNATETTPSIGVVMSDVDSGDEAAILMFCPIVWMIASGAISAGDEVTPHTAGKVQTKTGADKCRVGIAVNAVTTDGDAISVVMLPGLTL